MVDSADHITGKTGLTVTVTIRKPGGSFASPSGAVSEIANGWYRVAANATDNNTTGALLLHATATGADPTDAAYQVVAHDNVSTATPSVGTATSVSGAVGSVTGNVGGNVVGSVASVTNDVGITQAGADKVWGTTTRALTDKIGFALSAAGNLAIWDVATSLLTTVGSIGKRIVDFLTGDAFARLGAPVGASISADIAGVPGEVADEALAGHTTAGTLGKAISDIDAHTDTEVAAILAAVDTEVATLVTNVGTLITQLTGNRAELVAVPAANATLGQKIDWLFQLARNKRTTTNAADTTFRDDGSTVVATAALSDDTTTLTRGEYS